MENSQKVITFASSKRTLFTLNTHSTMTKLVYKEVLVLAICILMRVANVTETTCKVRFVHHAHRKTTCIRVRYTEFGIVLEIKGLHERHWRDFRTMRVRNCKRVFRAAKQMLTNVSNCNCERGYRYSY